MKSVISIGNQDFISIRKNNCFYIDKTDFIREWWDNQDSVTLITRPRRFGKTLNMSMVEYFFSVNHSECSKYFEDLVIWKEERFRKLQGTYPKNLFRKLCSKRNLKPVKLRLRPELLLRMEKQ